MKIFKKLMLLVLFARPLAFVGIFLVYVSSALVALRAQKIESYNWNAIVLGGLACGFLASAAHVLNNIFDRQIDKINKPFRLLSTGQLLLPQAWAVAVALYILSISLSFLVNGTVFVLVMVMAVMTIVYSAPPFCLKKSMLISNINIAVPRGLLVVLSGWGAVGGIWHILPWYIGIISFLYLVGAVSTKDISDVKGDRQYDCQTLPVKYGFSKTGEIILPFLTLPFLLIPIGVYFGILVPAALPLTLLLLYGRYIVFLVRKRPLKEPAIEYNHISWAHAYTLYMIYHLGMAVAYFIPR